MNGYKMALKLYKCNEEICATKRCLESKLTIVVCSNHVNRCNSVQFLFSCRCCWSSRSCNQMMEKQLQSKSVNLKRCGLKIHARFHKSGELAYDFG